MYVARCLLTLHDTLFFATREMGTLYETERYIHNYALAYALFNDRLLGVPYFAGSYEPQYRQDLEKLNQRRIYITPARPVSWDYILVTWKMGQVTYHRRPEKFGGKNYPVNFGRAKELAPGSTFEFFALSEEETILRELPRWIRLGKWASKGRVEIKQTARVSPKQSKEPFIAGCALNPLDVTGKLIIHDVISMPPSSLVDHVLLEGSFYEINDTRIPAEMGFRVPGGQEKGS